MRLEPEEPTYTEVEITALRSGAATGDSKIDALTRVVREAAADAQLAEAFAHLGLTMFTGYFLNFAQTDPDP